MSFPNALRFEAKFNRQRFPQPPPGDREWYTYEALRALPRIILMIDKNEFSETYGCFDREFWHYRTTDFPCAMNQEFCLPLALAYSTPFPNNAYYQSERLKELVIASIEFAQKTTHEDGSCDDYFPYERALGAHVFSTYAMTESYIELDLNRPDLLEFFRLRGDWLLNNNESGQLTNHQAFAALALYNVYILTGDDRYLHGSHHFRDITLSWQQEEGWFQEYEGADPGYHSCSIAFLGKLYQKSKDQKLIEPLKKAVEFSAYFMHPDGSYAGEYGSRNTYHFYPHGFEIMAPFSKTATRIAETYLHRSLPERRRYFNDDNRMCAHYVYDWMQAWRDYHPQREGLLEEHREPFTKYFKAAGLLVKKTPHYYAILALNKGGVLKVFDENGPIYSDTGLMAKTDDDKVLVSHLVDQHNLKVDHKRGEYSVEGAMSYRRQPLPSPTKQILFRGMNLSVGRWNAHLVRQILQKVLITGKPKTKVRFRREFVFHDDHIECKSSIDASKDPRTFTKLAIGSDATSIYVANSNTFQESTLIPWRALPQHIYTLNQQHKVEIPKWEIRPSDESYTPSSTADTDKVS
ncbi:MAG: hypothetical protein CL920_31840 [Deltaproteobacteria bacterium]|nr:hypothetical protein [Deltaproteobacteria bacterium]MBU53312.1 hypothetical protein [Deltaproteobacteria bacterium]|tara:strand:+ start:6328 stop:8058 length:1731 start_codon:yes stop_codon:yes gene_type:complete